MVVGVVVQEIRSWCLSLIFLVIFKSFDHPLAYFILRPFEGGFVASLSHLAVLDVRHRPGSGESERHPKFSAFRRVR